MPGSRFAGERVFGNKVAAPQADVRADHRLDQVQHFVGKQKFQQARVALVYSVHAPGTFTGQAFLKNCLEPGELIRRKKGLVRTAHSRRVRTARSVPRSVCR